MNEKTIIFEGEEASKFLDYFIAYRGLLSTIDHIKCFASQNPEAHIKIMEPLQDNTSLLMDVDNI